MHLGSILAYSVNWNFAAQQLFFPRIWSFFFQTVPQQVQILKVQKDHLKYFVKNWFHVKNLSLIYEHNVEI